LPWTFIFWSPSAWNHAGAAVTPLAFPAPPAVDQVTPITNALNGLAALSGPTGRATNTLNGKTLRIGYDPGNVGEAFRFAPDPFIVLDIVASNKFHFFNSFGKLVQGDLGLTIMHEFLHIFLQEPDSPSTATDAMLDTRDFDFRGKVIDEQNKIAKNAGLTDQIQVSYLATTVVGDAFHGLFTTNVSYTDGNEIDKARLDLGSVDSMDHSLNTRMLRDLFFGLDGADTIKAGKGRDYVYGGDGNDIIWGGDGNDVLVGEADNDYFRGGKGDDIIWGGGKDSSYQGSGDGTDVADYSQVRGHIEISFDAATDKLTVEDGEGGTDTLASIDRVMGSARNDSFTFTGSGTGAKVDMTDVLDGYVLTTQNTYEVRVMGIETFIGGDALTVFIGRTGAPAIFRAGSGGGDFTMTSGDRAYGHDGAVDTFRVTTTVPTEMSTCTEAEKTAYLLANRNFIGNFDAEDLLYVNGVLCNGNIVTAAVSPAVASDYNRDGPVAYVSLTGDSSYGTAYAQAAFDQRGLSWDSQPWGPYIYTAGEVRDVNFHRTGEDGRGVISFSARTISPEGDGVSAGYTLDALSSADEMLAIVIEGFEDGDGGMSFLNDPLANFGRPTIFDQSGGLYTYTHGVSWSEPDRIWVSEEYDLDGNEDGYLSGGGTPIDSDSADFNLGLPPFAGAQPDWQNYVLGGDIVQGGAGADTLDGGTGSDILHGHDGIDILMGGDGDDQLFGEAGEDILLGNAGDDLLDGGTEIDVMAGGIGDDTYLVDEEDDAVTEDWDAGTDTVVTSLSSYTLGANVENLGYAGFGNFTGTGNALDNLLMGGEGDDTLAGEDGDDSFQSSAGADVIDGGDGIDTFRIIGRPWGISLSETWGTVTVVDYNFETGTSVLTGVERLYFSDLDESFTIAEVLDPSVTGTNGDDDPLEGNNLDNEMFGLDGDDLLWGAGGNDTLDGGDGFDTAWFAGSSSQYRAYWDSDGTAWVDALESDEASDWLIDMEAIYFADDDVTLLLSALPSAGTSGNDVLSGSSRPDALFGLEGDDSLDGLAGDDSLDGGEGNDLYLLGAGNDSVYDTAGDDAYVYNPGDGDDTISDQGDTDYLEFGSGIDPLDVTVTGDGDGGYYLSLADGSVWIQYGSEPGNAIEEVRFADTTVWTDGDLYDMAYGESLMRGGGGGALQSALWEQCGATGRIDYLGTMADFHAYIP
jgi:Ca2+-binding RTX toxin-like protein